MLIFAAGNSGAEGEESCGSPSISKNSLGVGAEQFHEVVSDALHSELTVTYFSSMGPTYDGRIKPDIISPGDYVMSAFSGPPEALESAIRGYAMGQGEGLHKVKETCSVIQMSGTSMAAPATAGAALLIRQYFMDSNFWASICNRRYATCRAGAFEPSGYFLKGVFLHSGQPMDRYSVPIYDNYMTKIPSFKLGSPPDVYQGYGAVRLSNVLPLKTYGGLDAMLDLVVWDVLSVKEHGTLQWKIDVSESLTEAIKITVCWYDPPSPLYSSSSLLVHDIDLLVRAPNGHIFWGNRVSGGDDVNPNEQIHISSPECSGDNCIYEVFVHAHMLPDISAKNVSVIMTTSGEFNSFHM